MSALTYLPRPRGPQLNDWVWVTGYIDFEPGQRELCRVCKGDYPNQLVLHGYWQTGEWFCTEVWLDLHPPVQRGRRRRDYRFTKLPPDVLPTGPQWEAAYIIGKPSARGTILVSR